MNFIVFVLPIVFGNVLYAVNCGGEEYIDSKGVIWSRDKDFDGGLTLGNTEIQYIRFTQDPFIYMTERQHYDNFSYYLPRLPPGKYVIVLKFLEYFNAKNRKILNIAIGSHVIASNMEVYEGIKDLAAIDEFIPIHITEKGLYWNGLLLPDAFKLDKILLKFIKIGSEYPKICGIIIYNGTLEDTYYEEHIEKVKKFKQLLKNKSEISEKPISFPKDHTILTPVTATTVVCKYPLTICIFSITLYVIVSKFITKT